MANHQVSSQSILSVVDKRRSTAGSVAVLGSLMTTPLEYTGINAMRTRLTAISATAYSAANLNAMTVNDMEYALRLNDDPTSIV